MVGHSPELTQATSEYCDLPDFLHPINRKVMIRPRAGDFFYSNEELEVMLEDIGLFKSISVTGVVFGVLNPDGTVDVPRTRMYVVGLHSPYTALQGAIDSWELLFQCKVTKVSQILYESAPRAVAVCFHRAFDMTLSAIEGVSKTAEVSESVYRRQLVPR